MNTNREAGYRRTLAVSLAALTVALIAALAPRVGHAKEKESPPNLNGVWRLDESQSESLQDKLSRMRPGGPGGMGGMPPGGRGGMPPGGMGGRPPTGRGPEGDFDPENDPGMRALARPPMTLVVEQTDSSVVLSERGRVLRTLLVGAPREGRAEAAAVDFAFARWKGKRLESESAGARGGRMRETLELAKDGAVLIITTRMDGPSGMPALELKRVYKRYDGD